MPVTQPLTVSQMVRADYRLADVFKKWGVNYCCGGNRTLDEVCQLQHIDKARIEADMQRAQQRVLLSNDLPFDAWPLDFLADYIVHVHHAYIKTIAPALEQRLALFTEGHLQTYPYLAAVHGLFKKLRLVATEQMQYEEAVVFPYVKQANHALKHKENYGPLFVRTLRKPLQEAMAKQKQLLELLGQLRDATQQYTFPEKACTNHQVLYHKLNELDADLVQHHYLEHQLLFPKLAQLETEMLQL